MTVKNIKPTPNSNPDYKPPIGNDKYEGLKTLLFANAFYEDLVLKNKYTPEQYETLSQKEILLSKFCFAVGYDLLLELIQSAGLDKEYKKYCEDQKL